MIYALLFVTYIIIHACFAHYHYEKRIAELQETIQIQVDIIKQGDPFYSYREPYRYECIYQVDECRAEPRT